MKSLNLILSIALFLFSFSVNSQTTVRQSITAGKSFSGIAGQCELIIRYANGNSFSKAPLIVVEGFDAGHIISPESRDGTSSILNFIQNVENITPLSDKIDEFDIVYVNWKNGTDFLQRNAFALETAIQWVNTRKAINGVSLANVIMGQSMGGVITRYALKDMENHSLQHNVKLYISHDAPHQGANVPQGFQHLARQGRDLYVRTGLTAGLVETVQLLRNRFSPLQTLSLADQPASRQMLYNYVNASNDIDNTQHDAWQTELRNLGYPQGDGTTPFRKISVSNGAECGSNQAYGAGSNLFTYQGKGNTRFLGDLQAGFAFLLGGSLLNQPYLYLGILPGRNDFEMDFAVNAQADAASNQIYKGSIIYKKKILYLIPVQTTITNRTFNSSASTLPLDHAQGGAYRTNVNLNSSTVKAELLRYNIVSSAVDRFNFVPTASALDIGGGTTSLVKNDYFIPYPGANPPSAPKNSPFNNFVTAFDAGNTVNLNEEHISFEDRNGGWLVQELSGTNGVVANCQLTCNNPTFAIVGPDLMCTSQVFSVSNVPAGVPVNWTLIPSSIGSVAPNGSSATITKSALNGVFAISASIGSCGTSTVIQRSNLYAGKPSVQSGTYSYTNSSGTSTFSLPTSGNENPVCFKPSATAMNATPAIKGGTQIAWAKDTGPVTFPNSMNGPTLNLTFKSSNQTAVYDLSATNTCGVSGASYLFKSYTCSSQFQVSPNPAGDNANVTRTKEAETEFSLTGIPITFDEIRIYDLRGNLRKSHRYTNAISGSIFLGALKSGVYVIEIVCKDFKEQQQLIIAR